MAERRGRRNRKAGDALDADFGPAWEPGREAPGETGPGGGAGGGGDVGSGADGFAGPGGGIPCGRDGCFLKPLGDLAARFALELARRGHSDSAVRAATSGIGLLKALRDFLDEEIALAERAAEARRGAARYTKIPVE